MMEMKNDLIICWDVRGVEIIAWMVLPLTKIGNLEGKKMFWVGDVFFFCPVLDMLNLVWVCNFREGLASKHLICNDHST